MGLNEALRNLYLVDQQVRGLESRLEGAEKRVRMQQVKLEQLHQQRDELASQLRHAEAHAATLENEINSKDAKIAQLREQMNSVRTNKEYSAMLVEVNTLKADRGKIEEQALELMGQIDAYKEQMAALEGQVAEQEKVKELAERELADRHAEVKEQLERVKAERAEAASQIPPEALGAFERLAETYEGEAMAPVIEEDRRRMEYVCGGCYMQIPVEKVNLLLSQDQMVRCSSCQRLLYLEPELKEAMGF